MRDQITIRCDANQEIGHGHLVRCFSLACTLEAHFDLHFVCKNIPSNWANKLQERFQLTLIDTEDEFFSGLKPNGIVVLDGYHFDSIYQKQIKNNEQRLVVIDDLVQGTYHADLIINTAPNVRPTDYLAQAYTHYALGLSYALLRPAILALAKKKKTYNSTPTLFICFGGSDSKNLSLQAYQTVAKSNFFSTISIVTGESYSFQEELRTQVEKDPRVKLYHGIDEDTMAEVLEHSDYALVPASGMLHEAIAAKCIPISGKYVENQAAIYDHYKQLNCIIDAKDFSPSHIEQALEQVEQHKVPVIGLIDGLSEQRLINKIFKLTLRKELGFRIAEERDLELTFSWANNPSIRQYAFSNHVIRFEEHKTWFQKKLKDKNTVYFIIEFKKKAIGSIRFDIVNDRAVISYLADTSIHGKGFGKVILSQGIHNFERYCKENNILYSSIIGFVKNENSKSQHIFSELNFKESAYNNFKKFTYNLPIKNTLKIGLLVSGALGFNCLKRIRKAYEVPFVFTNPSSIEIIAYCQEENIPYIVGNPRNKDLNAFLENYQIDVLFSINYLYLIERNLILKPKVAALNIHGSLLPKYRGRTPHVWAIINGETTTGISVHEIDLNCDTGDLVYQTKIPIGPKTTGGEILQIFKKKYPGIVLSILKQLKCGQLASTKQDHHMASYFDRRTPQDGLIDWNWNSKRIVNWVRAQSIPYPGAFTFLGDLQVIIDALSKVNEPSIEWQHLVNGTLVINQQGQFVKCQDGLLKIERVRNKMLNFEDGQMFGQKPT